MACVDVIVPCYNYGRYLEECIHSALAQKDVDVRVLIIDDFSSDNTETVGTQLAAQNCRVIYKRHTSNQGHIATYNEGLDWASRDYTLLLSADDMLTPGALGRATRLMDSHPEVGMTYGDVISTSAPNFTSATIPTVYRTEIIPGPVFIETSCRVCCTGVETVTAVVRTSVQKAVGSYRKELTHAGDQEMWLRFASVSDIGRIQAPQGYYRRHTANMSIGYYEGLGRRDYDQIRAAFEFFFANASDQLLGQERLLGMVHRELAIQAFYLANEAFDAGHHSACNELMAEAKGLWPAIQSHRGWRRLRVKQNLGSRLWSYLRPLLRSRRPPQVRTS